MIGDSRRLRPFRQTILGGPADEPGDSAVEFRLTYGGLLRSAQHGVADHKHEIRKVFHKQLKRFWGYSPFFRDSQAWSYSPVRPDGNNPDGSAPQTRKDQLANMNTKFGHRFVPIACADLCVFCAIDVLFLRPDPPGAVWSGGDIDNRIKTLIDALQMPQQAHELGKYQSAGVGEDPFFVLLENDKLVTRLNVETDMLLEPTCELPQKQDCRLIVTVTLTPYQTIWGNMGV